MAKSLRLQLRRVVLESGTHAGRIYNLVISGAILLSVAGLLLRPHPMRVAASGEIPAWLGELERGCLLVFTADYLMHLWVSGLLFIRAASWFDRPLGGAVLLCAADQQCSDPLDFQVRTGVACFQAAALHG